MDTAQLTIIIGAVTTIAAIIGPILGTVVSNRYALRLKRMELNYPKILDTISALVCSYNSLYRIGESPSDPININVPAARYANFVQSCHQITALLPSKHLRSRTRSLLSKLESSQYCRSKETDDEFSAILEIISEQAAKKL